jgi:hypothetical protein
MEPTSLTVAAIITALVIEASKETGKLIVKGSHETVIKIIETVRNCFKVNSTEGILNNLQNNPSEVNESIFTALLEAEVAKNPDFSESLSELLKKIDGIDILSSQEMLSNIEAEGDIKVANMQQKSTKESQSDQKMAVNLKANNITLGDLSQKN